MPLLGATGGGSAKGFGALANLGYFIRNSLRFRASASARLTRTFGTTGTNNKIQTFSVWVKRGLLSGSADYRLMGGYDGTSANSTEINFDNDNLRIEFGGAANNPVITTQVFRDPSAWYHIVIAIDTTQATAANRIKMYVNGNQITAFGTATYPAQNAVSQLTSANANNSIGSGWSGFDYFDGYMGEINFIDGQALTPSSFGKTDPATDQWIPKKFAGTYGTNGFYLKFADASAATAAAIGKDSSPNGNNWTPNNISVTAGVTYDAMIDSPTLSAAASNYAVWNPLSPTGATCADGNLQATITTSGNWTVGTFAVSSGKYYFECVLGGSTPELAIGIAPNSGTTVSSNALHYYSLDGKVYSSNSDVATGATFTSGDIIGVAFEPGGNAYFYKNNTLQATVSMPAGSDWCAEVYQTATRSNTATVNFGQRPFSYTPPSGFKSLNTFNLP